MDTRLLTIETLKQYKKEPIHKTRKNNDKVAAQIDDTSRQIKKNHRKKAIK